jgi:hypothetical protein
LPVAVVGDGGGTSRRAGGNDLYGYGVSSSDGDTGEVEGEVGEPLIPRIVGDSGSRAGPVNTSLENGAAAGVAVNSDPGLKYTSVNDRMSRGEDS